LLLFVFFNRQYLIFSLCEYLYGICRLYVIFVLLMIFDAFFVFYIGAYEHHPDHFASIFFFTGNGEKFILFRCY